MRGGRRRPSGLRRMDGQRNRGDRGLPQLRKCPTETEGGRMLALATHRVTAVAIGAFMVCTETCLHFGSIVQGPWVEMPWHDWIAATWLPVAGLRRRVLELAIAWAFMASLLVGSLFGHI